MISPVVYLRTFAPKSSQTYIIKILVFRPFTEFFKTLTAGRK